MFDSAMRRYHTDEYQKFQEIVDYIRSMQGRLGIAAPEFEFTIEAHAVFHEWARAAINYIALIRDVFAYNLNQNVSTPEENSLAKYNEIQNEKKTSLFSAQYLLADHYVKKIFSQDTEIYFTASGVYNQLVEYCPNLLRFGTQLLSELQQNTDV